MRYVHGNFMQGKNSKHINGLYSFFGFGSFQGKVGWFESDFGVVVENKMANFESGQTTYCSLAS